MRQIHITYQDKFEFFRWSSIGDIILLNNKINKKNYHKHYKSIKNKVNEINIRAITNIKICHNKASQNM